jgi:hypothetical protein
MKDALAVKGSNTRLVVIGKNLDRAKLTEAFNACLA